MPTAENHLRNAGPQAQALPINALCIRTASALALFYLLTLITECHYPIHIKALCVMMSHWQVWPPQPTVVSQRQATQPLPSGPCCC